MNKTLILYYSYEGSTKKIAEYLSVKLGANIQRVTPVKEMISKGFIKYIWGGSQVVMKKKPEIKPLEVNLDDYDTIMIGSPIWAGTFAPPIYTLLESGKIQNKKIAYFYCHEGGDKNAAEKAKVSIEKYNEYLSAFSCLSVKKNYGTVKENVLEWAKSL